MYPRKKLKNYYEGEIKPFKIIDGLYFVGSYKESCHLVDTGDGLLLIDVGDVKNVYLVVNSIYESGFSPKDVKYILLTHKHYDHTGGVKEFAGFTGAKTFISEIDGVSDEVKSFFTPDYLIKDGEELKFGNITVKCMLTAGHTKGTMSYFFDMKDGGKTYRVGMFGGAGVNTLVKTHADYYEGNRKDYLDSVDRLLKEKVDVFIGNHCWNNDTDNKGKAITADFNPFIDGKEWVKFLNFCKNRCLSLEK